MWALAPLWETRSLPVGSDGRNGAPGDPNRPPEAGSQRDPG